MLKLDKIQKAKNIAELLDESELNQIAHQVVSGYELDKASRAEWEDTIEKAMDIAKQTCEEKNFPWPKASNVKFPLITKGGIDFAARMLPEIIQNDKIVKVTAPGDDPNGLIARRAARVQEHMSYQLLKQSDEWEDGMDKLLHVLPVLGTVFKKTYYNPIDKRLVSELCLPDKIVVNYNTRNLEKARRITHEFTFFSNDILSRIRSGIYLDVELEKLRGSEEDQNDQYDPPMELLEQHCWLDLDEDDFPEPYIVVLHKRSKQVLRIVNRFKEVRKNSKGEVEHIEPQQYFTDYHFIPSPDGGFYSIGFGTLLYPLNESINTLLNQLIDSGTLHNQQSGFIGRGLRIRSGEFKMAMGEWKVLDSAAGTNLSQNIVPLPTKEPSNVLFQLLGLLIEIGKDLTSTNDALEGKQPGHNVAATTMLTLVEQGLKVYSAITKRLYRALKKELKKLFLLNYENLTDEEYRKILNNPLVRVKDDYELDSFDILPVADPSMASNVQRVMKAQALTSVPGLDPYETTKYYLEALDFDAKMIERVLKKPDPNAPPPPEHMKMMAEIEKLKADAQATLAEAQMLQEKNRIEAAKLQMQQQEVKTRDEEAQARIQKMKADAHQNEAKVVLANAKADHEAQMDELKLLQDKQVAEADLTLKSMDKLTAAEKLKIDARKVEVDSKKANSPSKGK